jgi:uncharacterized protein
MKRLILFILILLAINGISQNTVVTRIEPSGSNYINVKWYYPKMINADGFFVYRKASAESTWQKLTPQAIKFKEYKFSKADLDQDKELKNYTDMVANPANMKDLVLLATVIKSFKSEAFSKYLGIWYDDKTAQKNTSYQYKVTIVNGALETDLAVSESLLFSAYAPIAPPKEIKYEEGNKKISFKWMPEPNRYFGVNIYRKINDTGAIVKLTKDPIILSQAKNKKGEMTYGEEFFVDKKLKDNTKYIYTFEALDFFGTPSTKSDPLTIFMRDKDAPKAPDSVYNKLDGKKVFVKWKKRVKEFDLAGYNVYRTNQNDSDYAKINTELILAKDTMFTDVVSRFGSYMYAVSAVDKDGNEGVSNPYLIEVYDNEPPSQPKNLTIQADSGKLMLRWTKNPEEDVQGYLIYRTINKNNEDTYVKITPVPISDNFFTDKLEKNIKNKFLYKVVAIDKSLNKSPYSDFAVAKMPDVVAPNIPFLKTVEANERGQLVVDWIPNADLDLLGYSIYRKDSKDTLGKFVKLNAKLIDSKSFRYIDRNVEEDVLYEYYLEAFDSTNNTSKPSNHLKQKVKSKEDNTLLSFSNFEASYNSKKVQVELKWKIKNESQLKSFVVYRMLGSETVFSPVSGSIEETKFTDKTVSKNQLVVYQVRAYNVRGDVFKSEKQNLELNNKK